MGVSIIVALCLAAAALAMVQSFVAGRRGNGLESDIDELRCIGFVALAALAVIAGKVT